MTDTEAAVYRVRLALGAMLCHKKQLKKIPQRYAELSVLLDKIHVSDDEDDDESNEAEPQSDLDTDSDEGLGPSQTSIVSVSSGCSVARAACSPKNG